ncbi:MAG TPA: hypothetical protein VFZ65_03725 [Planctomycetota bacterium]|nr:hypothetical protein [Planctomycetota bacterium]
MTCPPLEPHASLVPFAPTARRELSVFGAPATLVLVPGRGTRQGRATNDRPAFRRSAAARIVRDEAFWRGGGLALTPNRYPFAHAQRLLWPEQPLRDPDANMWTAIGEWAAASGGTALLNNVGAAATIARAHAHLLPERLPFLDALRELDRAADLIDVPPGVELVRKDVPFCLVGVRGGARDRAAALLLLAEARLTAAWNVVVQDRTAWLFPRRVETPTPHFPYALGAAEVWGRWCYVDEEPFAAATAADLERALVAAGVEERA